jgi:hypothetical protein
MDIFVDFSVTAYDLGDADDDFLILWVRHEQRGPSPVLGAFSGLFLDFDLGGSGLDDVGSLDEATGTLYLGGGGGTGPYLGIAVAGSSDDCAPGPDARLTFIRNQIYIWPEAHIADVDKWGFLSGGGPQYTLTDAPVPDDYSVLASVGPFDLAPGEGHTATFIVGAGATLDDLLRNMSAARGLLCDGVPAGVDEAVDLGSDRKGVWLHAWPNPTAGPVHLDLRLGDGAARGGHTIELFDAAGRTIRRLPASVEASASGLVWDGRDSAGRLVPAGAYFARLRDGTRQATTRILVVH